MFSLISGIMSSKEVAANKKNTIHAFGGNRIVSENTNSINKEFSKPVVQEFKQEKANTIHCFGGNRIVEENTNVKQEFSKPIVKEYTSQSEIRKRNVHSEQSNRVYAFGCNRVIGNNSSQIKTSVFGFPFVK